MSQASRSSSRIPAASNPPERVKAPLVGIIAGVVLVGSLAAWTVTRIQAAEGAQEQVAAKRASDAERTRSQVDAPPVVDLVQGQAASWQPRVELDGTLEARQSASIAFKVPGKLTRIGAKVGDEVRAGSALGTLDASEAAGQVTASQAQVRAAEAQLALAEDTERRTASLVASGSFAEAGGVQTLQQRALASAQLDAARAQLALARVALGNHGLVAPFAGTVTEAPDGIGGVVNPGQALFRIVNVKNLKLESTASEADANLLKTDAKVVLDTEAGPVEGKITALLSALDPKTRRVPVHAEFENPGQLRVGSFVRATVEAGTAIEVLRLPHTVLKPGTQNEVFVATSDGSSRVLQLRQVIYALDKDGSLLVRRGIQAGDRVVVAPKPEFKAGDVVAAAPGGPASAAATTGATAAVEAPKPSSAGDKK